MVELWSLAPSFAAGVLLGAIYFGGLWWTVRTGLTAAQPAFWFLGSLLLRTAIALGGFFLVAGTAWARWLACLLGFIVARLLVHRLTQETAVRLEHEVGDAP